MSNMVTPGGARTMDAIPGMYCDAIVLFPFPDFGWDWGPAFGPVGIWRSIGLVFFNTALVTDVVPQVTYSRRGDSFSVSTFICVQVPDEGNSSV